MMEICHTTYLVWVILGQVVQLVASSLLPEKVLWTTEMYENIKGALKLLLMFKHMGKVASIQNHVMPCRTMPKLFLVFAAIQK